MWAKYEEIQKFTTVNRFSKITDIGICSAPLALVLKILLIIGQQNCYYSA